MGAVTAVYLLWFKSEDKPVQTASDIITFSPDTPDETDPETSGFVWKGSANDPRSISLPTINAEGYVQKVGIDQSKQIAVPSNVFMAGWYVKSARPGEKGLSIIDGHINGQVKDGIFAKLSQLKAGDEFELEMGNGKVLHYKIKDVQTVKLSEALSYLFSQQPNIERQLNLITCGGDYDPSAKTYEQRIIVVGEQVE